MLKFLSWRKNKLVALAVALWPAASIADTVKIGDINIRTVAMVDTRKTDWQFTMSKEILQLNPTLLELSFSANNDLRDLAKKLQINIYPISFVCDEKAQFIAATENLAFSDLADEHGFIGYSGFSTEHSNHQSNKFNYHVYLSLKTSPNSMLPLKFHYDLIQHPKDVCLGIEGEGMGIGKRLKSNVLRVRANQIRMAVFQTKMH